MAYALSLEARIWFLHLFEKSRLHKRPLLGFLVVVVCGILIIWRYLARDCDETMVNCPTFWFVIHRPDYVRGLSYIASRSNCTAATKAPLCFPPGIH